MGKLILEVEGIRHDDWISAEVELSLDSLAHRFSLRYLDQRESVQTDNPTPSIQIGSPCTLSILDDGGILDNVITGYVDKLRQTLSGNERVWTADGRSKTGDLVDCSAIHKTGTWKQKTAKEIIRDLCEPFEIGVSSDTDTERSSRFAIEEGETVFDAIDRLCKVRGLLPITLPNGNLHLTRIAETPPVRFPIEQAYDRKIEQDFSNRFSDYLSHATDVDGKGSKQDTVVERYRPLVIVPEFQSTPAQRTTRVQWELAVRAGRSERYHCTMIGLTDPDGGLYLPGKLYAVEDTRLEVSDSLVVARSVMRVGETEAVTDLELCRPESFALREYPNKLLSGTTKKGKKITHKTRAPKK